MAWVYLVRCGDGSIYCGATTDLPRRMLQHQHGRGAKYIRAKGYQGLATAWEVASLRIAQRVEWWLKQRPKAHKERLIAEVGEGLIATKGLPLAIAHLTGMVPDHPTNDLERIIHDGPSR